MTSPADPPRRDPELPPESRGWRSHIDRASTLGKRVGATVTFLAAVYGAFLRPPDERKTKAVYDTVKPIIEVLADRNAALEARVAVLEYRLSLPDGGAPAAPSASAAPALPSPSASPVSAPLDSGTRPPRVQHAARLDGWKSDPPPGALGAASSSMHAPPAPPAPPAVGAPPRLPAFEQF